MVEPGYAAPAGSVSDLVAEASRLRGDHPAVISAHRTETWAGLDALASSAARALSAVGLRPGTADTPGDRVAIILGNSVEFLATYTAVARAGLVAVPVNPGLTTHELASVLTDSGARLVVRAESVAGMVSEAAADLPTVRLMSFDALVAGGRAEHDQAPVAVDPESLALLLYTSGSAGLPKGAMLTHRALMTNVAQVAAIADPPVRPEDVVLLVLPLFHVYGLNGTFAQVARQGATLVLAERFDPAGTLATIATQRVTHLPVVPSMLTAWLTVVDREELRNAFASVRTVLSGAAPLPRATAEEFSVAAGVPVNEGYGLTEAAPGVTLTLAGSGPKPGSIGRPVPGLEIRLVEAGTVDGGESAADLADLPDADEDVTAGPGEVQLRGPNLFSGYWPDGSGGPDADGWFATGDVAYVDSAGDYVLVDRTRELIIVNGFNVYPREIELVLNAVPNVAESAVVGVPDESTGEAVKAFVVPMPGEQVDPDAVSRHCQEWLARFKQPREIVVVDRLPHSATGKVSKRALRADSGAADLIRGTEPVSSSEPLSSEPPAGDEDPA